MNNKMAISMSESEKQNKGENQTDLSDWLLYNV